MTLNQTYKLFNWLVITSIATVITYVMIINLFDIDIKCQISRKGLHCENCGVTRGLFEFIRLNIHDAYVQNPKSVFLGFIILFQLVTRSFGIYWLRRKEKLQNPTRIIIIELSILISVMITYRWI